MKQKSAKFTGFFKTTRKYPIKGAGCRQGTEFSTRRSPWTSTKSPCRWMRVVRKHSSKSGGRKEPVHNLPRKQRPQRLRKTLLHCWTLLAFISARSAARRGGARGGGAAARAARGAGT